MNEALNNKEFTHLKIHSQYSICEGALRMSDLAKYCKENKIKAVGLCDSNNLCGALEFSESIARSKTQPIIGTQINIEYKGNVGSIIYKLIGGLKSSMGYLGSRQIKYLRNKPKFVKITKAGFYESMVHNVDIVKSDIKY